MLVCPAFQSDVERLLLALNSRPAEEKPAEPPFHFDGKHILIAEDNEINMEIAVGLLEPTGAQISTAYNGREAVEKFKASSEGFFDLILMDVQMPEVDGCSAAREIRALPRTDAKMVRIFAMTANALEEDKKRCYDSGMDAHIGKPFSLEDIIQEYVKKGKE